MNRTLQSIIKQNVLRKLRSFAVEVLISSPTSTAAYKGNAFTYHTGRREGKVLATSELPEGRCRAVGPFQDTKKAGSSFLFLFYGLECRKTQQRNPDQYLHE